MDPDEEGCFLHTLKNKKLPCFHFVLFGAVQRVHTYLTSSVPIAAMKSSSAAVCVLSQRVLSVLFLSSSSSASPAQSHLPGERQSRGY